MRLGCDVCERSGTFLRSSLLLGVGEARITAGTGSTESKEDCVPNVLPPLYDVRGSHVGGKAVR